MNQNSPIFKSEVASSIFHYSARAKHSDCFKLFISTLEMEEAAWTYVHRSQLILDGTFRVSSSRLLLWIVMGVDSQGKGLPVAMFLFSAPAGTLATHAGYDIGILTHILTTWKDWLSSWPSARNHIFEPTIAITDTDAKERGALISTWPSIILLLCKFHLWQCWTNKRNTTLRKKEHFLGIQVSGWIWILESS
jgi:MULE transposase domain